MARRMVLALALALTAATPAWSQEGVEVCSRLTPAEAASLIGGAVVTPRPASTAELSNLAGTATATPAPSQMASKDGTPSAGAAQEGAAPADATPDKPIPRPVAGGACSYLASVGSASGLPPSQVQLTVNRFKTAAAANQAFDAARKMLRPVRAGAAGGDAPVELDEAGNRTFSVDTTAVSVSGETVALLSVIDFAVLVRGKPNPAVMERARLLARKVAGL